MRGPDRRLGVARTWAGRQAAALVLVIVAALLPLPAVRAQGATLGVRLDWGVLTRMPTSREALGLAAAPNGLLYAVGGFGPTSYTGTVEAYDPATNRWSDRAPMPTARGYHGLALASNGRLYAVGGFSGSDTLDTVEEYDPATNRWTARAPLRNRRMDAAMAAAPNGKLYVVGGSSPVDGVLNSVEEYDPATDTWVEKRPMRQARFRLAMAVAPNGRLYAVGGANSANDATAVVEEYDPVTDTWRDRAPLGTSLTGPGLATAANGMLYAVGGDNNAPTASLVDMVQEYDPSANRWTTKTTMPTSRALLGLAPAPDGKLYAVGGRVGIIVTTPVVEAYDPQANRWSGALTAPLPSARGYAASAVAGGKLYVFGGQSGGAPTDAVLQYSQGFNGASIWATMSPMPTGRSVAAAVTAPNGKIYVVGGYSGQVTAACPNSACTTVEEYTPPTGLAGGSWRGAADGVSQLPAPRVSLAMALGADGKLYVTGGSDFMGSRSETYQYDPATNSPWLPMASMHQPREGHGLAPAGAGKLYAVGGAQGTTVLASVERFVLPTPGNPQGSWEGPGGIAPLPGTRTLLGLVGLPNGRLIAAGGFSTGSTTTRSEVYEYDPAANIWTPAAPLPRASFGLGLAVQGARQLLAIGGFDTNTGHPLDMVAAGIRDELPVVSAGGPYTAQPGTTIQLAASGSDPEGDALSYAWDLDGSLRYATLGQTVPFSAAGLPPGPRTVRVRALDPLGGYAVASTTVTVPGVCDPRPNVATRTSRVGPGQLQAVITAQTSAATPSNTLQRLVISRIDNAVVTLNGDPVTAGASISLPPGTAQATLLLQRQGPGAGSTVSFVATDLCGDWRSFVGGGPGAF